MHRSDEELVRLHLRGEPQAFRHLVERYVDSVYNLAYRLTRDSLEAEDIAQETFLRVYQTLPRSRLDLPFKPWLFRIAVNLCRDWARKKKATPFSLWQSPAETEAPLFEDIPDEAPLPLEQMEAQEMEGLLRRAVAELPEAYRLAVTLRYNEGLSYQEMAEVLDIPLNTVRTHLFRARKLLREALEGYLEGEP